MKIKRFKSISDLKELETDLNKLCKILFDCGLGSVDLIQYNIVDDESKKYSPHEENWNYFIEYKKLFYITYQDSFLLFQLTQSKKIFLWIAYTKTESRKKGNMSQILKFLSQKNKTIIVDTFSEDLKKIVHSLNDVGIDITLFR